MPWQDLNPGCSTVVESVLTLSWGEPLRMLPQWVLGNSYVSSLVEDSVLPGQGGVKAVCPDSELLPELSQFCGIKSDM